MNEQERALEEEQTARDQPNPFLGGISQNQLDDIQDKAILEREGVTPTGSTAVQPEFGSTFGGTAPGEELPRVEAPGEEPEEERAIVGGRRQETDAEKLNLAERRRLSNIREAERELVERFGSYEDIPDAQKRRLDRMKEESDRLGGNVEKREAERERRRVGGRESRELENQRRIDAADWQRNAAYARQHGLPEPPMPSSLAKGEPGSFASPVFNQSTGQSQVRIDAGGTSQNINVAEDPNNPGSYFPAPTKGSNPGTYSGLAGSPEFNESMSGLVRAAREGGFESGIVDRFEKTQQALAALESDGGARFGSSRAGRKQYESAREQLIGDYGGLAKQLIDRSPEIHRSGAAEAKKDDREMAAFTTEVERNFERLRTQQDRNEYALPGEASERALMQEAIAMAHRTTGFRKVLEQEIQGNLSPEDSARAALDFFGPPSSRNMTSQVAPGAGMSGSRIEFSDEDLVSLDSQLRAGYEDLPYEVTRSPHGGIALRLNDGATVPGTVVPGYEVPVAVSQNQEQSYYFEHMGVPYVKRGRPNEVQDRGFTLSPREAGIEPEDFDYDSAYEKSSKDFRSTSEEAISSIADYDLELKNYKEWAAFERANPEEAQAVKDTRGKEKPEKPEWHADYMAALDQRNARLEDMHAQSGETDRADLNASMAAPLSANEFHDWMLDNRMGDQVARAEAEHSRREDFRLREHRHRNNDWSQEYRSLYETGIDRRTGQYTYTVRDHAPSYTPNPLRALPTGNGQSRMPVVSSPSDMANLGFNAPAIFVVGNEPHMIQITDGPVNYMGKTLRGLSSYRNVVNDPEKHPQTVRDIALNITAQFPGQMSRDELAVATEQMMRRLGYQPASERMGY